MDKSKNIWPSDAFIKKGLKINRYKIMDFVGSGGMGEVYLAADTELNRQVALKFQSKKDSTNPGMKAHFIREAQNAASLNHPNIVTIYEVGEYQHRPFIAMEYIEGHSLQELIDGKKLDNEKAVDIIIQICTGLGEAHRSSLSHQDIKPGNIIVSNSGQAKIIDFGLAQVEAGVRLSGSSSQLGTVSYMSPEQAKGDKVDARTDIFSTGVILFRLLTGHLPFKANYEAAILYAIVYQKLPQIDGMSADLQKILSKALEKKPEDRYQSIDEMLADLKNLTSDGWKFRSSKEKAPAELPSIAILQLSDLSPDGDQEYFCEGITEGINNALTKIDNLRVASRTSVIHFQKRDYDLHKIGQALNVNTVLEGSVRREGNKLRITVQLVNVEDGYYLWSEKYDRDITDLFAIQDEISRSIADKLKLQLDDRIKEPLVKRYTKNLEAYHLYLRGRHFWNKRYEGGLQKSIEFFQQAIEHDPAYALPYAGLADAYNIMAFYNFLPPHEACPRAKAAAAKAVEIDPYLAEAYTALGWVATFYDWNWVEAETNFKRAIELDPKYANAHHYYSLFLMANNRLDEGLHEVLRAYELDPLSMIINTSLGVAHYFRREHDEAIKKYFKALEFDPNFAPAHAYLAGPYVCQKKYDEALIECQKASSLAGGSTYATAFLGHVYGIAGEIDKAREILKALDDLSAKAYVSSQLMAMVYIGIGDKDNAFKWLDKACDERDNWMVWLNVYPVFDNLRADPRFAELLSKVGLKS
jgi:serine/threonine protein kinase